MRNYFHILQIIKPATDEKINYLIINNKFHYDVFMFKPEES